MNPTHIATIAAEMNLTADRIQAVARLLEDGATVPFISRYRKEATGSLDEVAVTAIRDRLTQLDELDSRRDTILKSLEQHGHLTDELKDQVLAAATMTEIEDIYLPYRPKRRTKATIAREKGLEPLALAILAQKGADPQTLAADYMDPEKSVETVEDALAGARDIIAETINEDGETRSRVRDLFFEKGVIHSRVIEGKEVEGAKFKDYFEWEESVATSPSHRILAMRRGEKEEILSLSIAPPAEQAIAICEDRFVTGEGPDAEQVRLAAQDAYKRLLSRSMETEVRVRLKERADAEAIRVFSENLRQLLLASPLGAKRVMGLDPGFRTGCKLVCLDRQGKLLHNDTIYPHGSQKQADAARQTVATLCKKFAVEAVAVGNGTAGRETQAFVKEALVDARSISVIMVNESGASVYSASETARQEFPDHDLTVRGSVSIGRRLMDPLSELVKIDPKSIGVGQYQHDVDQFALKGALDDVVVSCVNGVGVEVNRASVQLLTYVSGLGPQLAKNIVAYRDENGAFSGRDALKKVKRLGPKAFEQCAGFLRIKDGDNPLDASAVHPESYAVVNAMAKDLDCSVSDLMADGALRKKIDLARYVSDAIGLPTLTDILEELAKPGRDPREPFEHFSFDENVSTIQDLQPGMRLPGIVTNVTNFGAFVDVGVHQDGLVHISQLCDRFVKTPSDVVSVQQKVTVTVMEVDLARNRISLSMRSDPGKKPQSKAKAETPRKKRPASGPKKSPQPPKPAGPKPFNNPFADAFRKASGR
ncbi:RNA-binding transcriptional accessory protein [Desulfosarcina widdelii]|uniref:RNA-binding transcriptional accessory protein n=1 Tax=Desulfosarcina widdelii TaxID=947919 RepID=A0A5K7Z2N4_9BACT|nr:Tex family protein [Desulfosarcina widdelii]BBO72734.1 RNA-binding transcriptional accessory protein [Desulfosarcina widdelii]